MNSPGDTQPTPASRRRPITACLTALAVVLLTTALVGVVTGIEQAAHPPTCYGIGFGCTPDAATTALLVGAIYGLPTVGVAWAATWVGWALTRGQSNQANRAAAWWPVWTLVVAAVVVAVMTTAG